MTARQATTASAAPLLAGQRPRQGLTLPERPQLAPGVQPAGQMRGSGYKDPPWLLEREGVGYVQVTELLYRIAERCDGQRTTGAIALEVSQETGRTVSEDNVRQLLEGQFLAKGLIAGADGTVLQPPASARSLLAIRMRQRAVPAETVRRLAGPFRLFFWPPVMLAVLVAAIALEGWLFAVHGVAGGFRQTFYTSGLALAVMGMIVLAAAFHELGHAAALRYAGGRPGVMGVGLYLVYPAFYTDVTDNYRLSRWGRLRTDLGGFYFNLLFSLALAGLFALTGWEFLLVVVLLIAFQIAQQLLPFVRLDGYWTLVDLTGVPDFFSQTGTFARSLVPRPLRPGTWREPPALKWWARAVFGGYLLVTIPLLTFLLLLTVLGVPRVLATVWDAAAGHVAALGDDIAEGNWWAAALRPLQILLLAIPALGMGMVLFGLVRRIVPRWWNWSSGSAPRALAGSAVALAAVALLAYAWFPGVRTLLHGNQGSRAVLATSFTPIERGERGALADSGLPLVAGAGREARGEAASSASPSPSAAASATPSASPTPRTTATPAGTPASSTPTPRPATTATPAPATGTAPAAAAETATTTATAVAPTATP